MKIKLFKNKYHKERFILQTKLLKSIEEIRATIYKIEFELREQNLKLNHLLEENEDK